MPEYITVEEHLRTLNELVQRHPTALKARLAVDTEARCFDAHLFEVGSITHIPEEHGGSEVICMHLKM